MKSGNLNFLEPSGPLHACNGTALPLHFYVRNNRKLKSQERHYFRLQMHIKGKFHPTSCDERTSREQKLLNISLNLAQDEERVVNAMPRPLYPREKTRYPLYRRLGVPQDRSGQVWKISPPPRFDPRTIQPAARRYTDYGIPAPTLKCPDHR
jgi:hypothetical protein